jgi:hypothetical protein
LQVTLAETPLKEMSVSTAFFYISPGVPNKKDHQIKSHSPLTVPGKRAPSMVPHRGPYKERCSVYRASGLTIYMYFSEVPFKEPFNETGGKHTVTVHGAPRVKKGIVYDTAITNTVPCSLQYITFHLGLGRPERL